MNCRELFASAATAAAISAILVGAPALAQEKRPNIVMLMTDDTGWNDFGAYGGGRISDIRPRTWIASLKRELCSRAGMVKRVAPLAAPRS